jgi:radical SAM protein with 4Fe4S-binding SPASM domain
MNPEFYPFIPKHIVLRRYGEVHIYDLKEDESFIIDEEAHDVLKHIDGLTSNQEIISKFPEAKQEEIREALATFHELKVLINSTVKIDDKSIKSGGHRELPDKNPFDEPYLKNLMINITEKCNLTCKHCYIANKNPVDFPLDKLKALIREFYKLQGIRIILTGGEPLLYAHLKDLLIFLKTIPLQKVILSNGTLIKEDQEILNLLKENHVEIYVSLDGLEDSHNDFRDADCYLDTLKGIKILLKNGIDVSINTMVHKQNLNEFDAMYKIITSLGKIKNWSIDIPTFDDSTPENIRKKYEISPKEGGEILRDYGWGVIFESEGGDFNFACGPHLMAIDVVGTISKCGFFTEQSPGNIFELGLKKSWELTQKNLNWCLEELKCSEMDCEFIDDCRGGCRYRGFKYTGDMRGVDSYKCYQFGKLK